MNFDVEMLLAWVVLVVLGVVTVVAMVGCSGGTYHAPADKAGWRTLAYGNFGVVRMHESTGTCVLFHGNATVLPADVCASYK